MSRMITNIWKLNTGDYKNEPLVNPWLDIWPYISDKESDFSQKLFNMQAFGIVSKTVLKESAG